MSLLSINQNTYTLVPPVEWKTIFIALEHVAIVRYVLLVGMI